MKHVQVHPVANFSGTIDYRVIEILLGSNRQNYILAKIDTLLHLTSQFTILSQKVIHFVTRRCLEDVAQHVTNMVFKFQVQCACFMQTWIYLDVIFLQYSFYEHEVYECK